MAPLTRARCPEHIPTDMVTEYYAQRASDGGLIISEGAHPSVMVCNVLLLLLRLIALVLTILPRQEIMWIFLESSLRSRGVPGRRRLMQFTQRVGIYSVSFGM